MTTDEEKIFFENGVTLNGVFAGNIPKNIKLVEELFNVQLVARDPWIKICSESRDDVSKTVTFINELVRIYELRERYFEQRDFEHILALFGKNADCGKDLQRLYSYKIKVSPRKRDIVPRTIAQLDYIANIRSKDIVFGVGPAGTGKTYLAMAMAVSEFLQGNFSRIILTRPAREAGEALGFLPGKLEEKIMPYLRPLYDALYDMLEFEEATKLIEQNVIEVAPLAFMRGRTLNNAFVILDEAQNTTSDQMLMFLTRLGFDSQCVITGDPSQTDLEKNKLSGLTEARRILKSIPEIGFNIFSTSDVVRHGLVEKIISAYEQDGGGGK
ncbi:MAG: PhoH family protein [Victivallales bacterium]|nr:PhoH family protein [Victivallales bacterium]